jgi:hypothetical protein
MHRDMNLTLPEIQLRARNFRPNPQPVL